MPKRRKDNFRNVPSKKKNELKLPQPSQISASGRKKKFRPRTSGVRKELVALIEKYLTSNSRDAQLLRQNIRYNPANDEQPYILLEEFLSNCVSVDDEMRAKIKGISKEGLLKMNNLTSIFEMEEYPEKGQLAICFASTASASECSLYVTNTPLGCNKERLFKLLRKFGNVAEVVFPIKIMVPGSDKRKSRRTALVQLTEKESAQKMLEKYSDINQIRGSPSQVIKPKRHIRFWKRVLVRDSMIQKRVFGKNRKRKELPTQEELGGTANSITENRRRTKSSKITNAMGSDEDDMYDTQWPALRKRLKERRRRRNQRKKKVLLKTKVRRSRAIANRRVAPPRIRFRRRRRLRANRPGFILGSIDQYFSGIQVYTKPEFDNLQIEYRDLQRAQLDQRFKEYQNKTGDFAINGVKEEEQQLLLDKYVDGSFDLKEHPDSLKNW